MRDPNWHGPGGWQEAEGEEICKLLKNGVFEWVNDGNSVEDKNGQTNELHSYSKSWGKWIRNPEIEKRTKRK